MVLFPLFDSQSHFYKALKLLKLTLKLIENMLIQIPNHVFSILNKSSQIYVLDHHDSFMNLVCEL